MTFGPQCICPGGALSGKANPQCELHGHLFTPGTGIPEEQDSVNHPAHYGGEDNPYEAIKVIEAWNLDFCLGNAVKYISRAGKKGSAKEDLQKARWYLERAIWSGNYDQF